MEYLQLNWENWNEICTFTSKWFITGVFLNDKTKIPIEQPHGKDGLTISTNTIGLYLKLNGEKVLVKQDEYIIKEKSRFGKTKIKILTKIQFDRKRKLEQIWQ